MSLLDTSRLTEFKPNKEYFVGVDSDGCVFDNMVCEVIKNIPPIPGVHECLASLQPRADIMVCSSTPMEALGREWGEHGLDRYVQLIASQELGTKAEHLDLATRGRYEKDHVLMIGDAPGDYNRASKPPDIIGERWMPILSPPAL